MRDRAWRRWRKELRVTNQYRKLCERHYHSFGSMSYEINLKISPTESQIIVMNGVIGQEMWQQHRAKLTADNPCRISSPWDGSPRHSMAFKGRERFSFQERRELFYLRHKKSFND